MGLHMKLTEKYLLSKGFEKSYTENNKNLMEFTFDLNNNAPNRPVFVYLYDSHEVYFGVKSDYIVNSVEHFEKLCKENGLIL